MGRVYEGVGEAWVDHNEHGKGSMTKRGKRVSFSGEDLYSYSTVVARYKTNEKGDKYVVATNRRYSSSTSSHISNCVGKCTVPVFYSYDVFAGDATILAGMADVYATAVRSAVKGWKKGWQNWNYSLCHCHKQIVQFCALTGLKHALPPINEVTATIEMQRQEKKEAFDDPKAVAKRERNYARRQALKALKIAA